MNFLRTLILISLSISLSGCPTMGPVAPVELTVAGTFTHELTGMKFPEIVGRFSRNDITSFDEKRHHIGIGYNLRNPDQPIALTVYLFPAPRVLSIGSPPEVVTTARHQLFLNYYNASKQQVLNAHNHSQLINDGDFIIVQSDKEFVGKKASFEYEEVLFGKRQVVSSFLYLFHIGEWMVKYRVTYPLSIEKESEIKVTEFMQRLEFPKNS